MRNIENLDKLMKKLNLLAEDIEKAVLNGYQKAAVEIVGDAQRSIQQRSNGRPYVRYNNGRRRTGVASRPGDAPNTDTGRLVKSLFFEKRGKDVVVGSNRIATNKGVHYGAVLELSPRSQMRRPFLQPAVDKNKRKIVDKVRAEIRKAIRK